VQPDADLHDIDDHFAAILGDAEPTPRGESAATTLVRLASDRYRVAQSPDGRAFAVPLKGPAIARPLNGTRASLRAELAAEYFTLKGKTASRAALVDALGVLEGRAAQADREPLHLRIARLSDGIAIDLGDASGRSLVIGPGSWHIAPEPPVTFQRTELTSAIPDPISGGSLEDLRRVVNVTDEAWPLLVAWLVAVLFDVPRPLLLLTGEQGTGKTTTAARLAQLIDPSPAPTRTAPRDVESWVVAAAGSQVVALDNLSTVPDWLSDALCRASTGDALVKRQLYSNDQLAVITIRRAVILTSIDAGALRGDLGERLVPVELERIEPTARRTDSDIADEFERIRPGVLGALLDLAAEVLRVLPGVVLDSLPRMADFGRIVAAVDIVRGTNAAATYDAAVESVAADLVQGDPLAVALVELMHESLSCSWAGTSTQLRDALEKHRPDGSPWPKTPKALTGAITRLAPALRGQGVDITRARTGANGARTITIRPVGNR
jgi:hypothetical protein